MANYYYAKLEHELQKDVKILEWDEKGFEEIVGRSLPQDNFSAIRKKAKKYGYKVEITKKIFIPRKIKFYKN